MALKVKLRANRPATWQELQTPLMFPAYKSVTFMDKDTGIHLTEASPESGDLASYIGQVNADGQPKLANIARAIEMGILEVSEDQTKFPVDLVAMPVSARVAAGDILVPGTGNNAGNWYKLYVSGNAVVAVAFNLSGGLGVDHFDYTIQNFM